jgi:FAD/FMN-containing dehydrogenase
MDSAALASLREDIRGTVIAAGDEGYDLARQVRNGMIDKRPAVVVRPANAGDVMTAVRFAGDNDMTVAVRGGGHSVPGYGTNDDGVVVDLSSMRDVRVDPLTHTARVAGGATWGDLNAATYPFGLATTGGIISTTGVGGLTLGGGIGYLARGLGLALDNLLSADVVAGDGSFHVASDKDDADLFWAIRGGGGNFGVVTSFEFRCYPVGPTVFLGAPMYPMESAGAVLRAWRDFMATAPEELSSNAILWSVPAVPVFPAELHGRPIVILATMYPGDLAEGERLIQPLRQLATPLLDLSGPIPYTQAQAAFDPFFPYGTRRNYWKGIDLLHLGDDVIDRLLEAAASRPTPASLLPIWHFGGAMSRVEPTATAFWRRHVPFMASFDGVWDDPADDEKGIAWARTSWAAMQAYSDGGQYVNFPGFGEEGEAQVRSAYGGNYERLVAVKTTYDPTNLFSVNVNIKPKA